jgi:hypothetical protein
MRGTPHVLEVGLFLIIGAELRAIQLARGRAPCIEMLLERLPTVGATTERILDREPADHNHHAPVLMKVLAFQLSANLLEINLKVYISFDVAQFSH